MAPNAKKSTNALKAKTGTDEDREEPLQAVVLADCFETRFNPFTLERPRCLLPLVNAPLIEYTLEFLASVGAEEVFLCCGNHVEQVEEYLQYVRVTSHVMPSLTLHMHSKWTKSTSPFSLEVVHSTSTSIGDAMRDLDQKQLITGDFICVYGDVVANVPLEAALAAHRARREKDKKAIMTMVLREAGDFHRTKSQHLRPCFVIDPEKGRCVHYEQVRPRESPRLDIAEDVLKDHVEVEVREDLIDCGIDICTPEVLAQWSDNFDWQMPRRGFLYGVLKDFETNQLTIHAHIMNEGYAARVRNLQAYDAISKDARSRWTYPFCPDSNLLADQSYQLQRGHVYKEDGVILARSSIICRNVVLGKATSVGDGSMISDSVIGRRCVIGRRVKIHGAYIWDDARIGDNTIIDRAIIGSEASVGKNCTISEGAMVSYGVQIADGTTVLEHRRITRYKRKHAYDENDDVVRAVTDPKIVGEGGAGFELELDEEEEDAAEVLLGGMQGLDFSIEEASVSDVEEEELADMNQDQHHRTSSRSDSFASIGSDESGETRHRAADFHHEAVSSIFDSLQKEDDPDNIQLELTALAKSTNAEEQQVRRAVAVAINKRVADLMTSGQSVKDAIAATISPNRVLVARSVKSHEEQAEFMLLLQIDLVHRPQGAEMLLFASNALATDDLVEGEGLEQWWNDSRSSASDELLAVREKTKQIVDILADDEEDDEE